MAPSPWPELASVRERIERAGFDAVELEAGLPAEPGELLVVTPITSTPRICTDCGRPGSLSY